MQMVHRSSMIKATWCFIRRNECPAPTEGQNWRCNDIFMRNYKLNSPPLNYLRMTMTGLIANGNRNNEEVVITSDSFFPGISSKAIREALRFDWSITDQRLIPAIESAIIEVNDQLESLTSKAASIAEISQKTITTKGVEKPITEVLYFRAVAAAVGAELTEKYRAYDTNNNGGQKADDLTPTIDDYRRDLRFAIRDLKKIRRLNVELV